MQVVSFVTVRNGRVQVASVTASRYNTTAKQAWIWPKLDIPCNRRETYDTILFTLVVS